MLVCPAFYDAHAAVVAKSVDLSIWKSLGSRAGGEVMVSD